MILTQFIKRVDMAVKESTREALESFIHDLARTLPEKDRVDFLKKLESVAENVSGQSNNVLPAAENIQKRMSQAWKSLEKIEDGQLCLMGSLNEEYDDWYDSMADEFIFEDPQNI